MRDAGKAAEFDEVVSVPLFDFDSTHAGAALPAWSLSPLMDKDWVTADDVLGGQGAGRGAGGELLDARGDAAAQGRGRRRGAHGDALQSSRARARGRRSGDSSPRATGALRVVASSARAQGRGQRARTAGSGCSARGAAGAVGHEGGHFIVVVALGAPPRHARARRGLLSGRWPSRSICRGPRARRRARPLGARAGCPFVAAFVSWPTSSATTSSARAFWTWRRFLRARPFSTAMVPSPFSA